MLEVATDVVVPERESDDYNVLCAWYSGFAFAEIYRKVVLAQCREIERARASTIGVKTTEARLDDQSRLHPHYLDYLGRHLAGRTIYEREFLRQGGLK